MLTTLSAKLPRFVGTQLFSSDPSTNFLVGKDDGAHNNGCLSAYQKNLNVGPEDSGVVPDHSSSTCTHVPSTTNSGKPFSSRFADAGGGLNIGPNCKAYCPCCAHEML